MAYRVKNWRQFQHYKDRNPPWIKLHFAMLASEDWVSLDDASRVLAIACMLIASRNEGVIPSNPGYIKRVAYLNRVPNFKPLIDCGFLEYESDCKQMLAGARPETETETYKEETEKRANSARKGSRLPTGWKPSEILTAWAVKERPDLNAEQVVEKFRDYWGSVPGGKGVKLDWEATFRNFVRTERAGASTSAPTDYSALQKRLEEEEANAKLRP